MSSIQVRVGILIECEHNADRGPNLCSYKLFYIRGSTPQEEDWVKEAVSLMGYYGGIPAERTMKVGERRRYWATIRIEGWTDYWGEYEESTEVLKYRRAK